MASCLICGKSIPDDANLCPYCGYRRSFVRSNYYRVGPGSPGVIGATLTSVGEYVATGSFSTALFDQLSREGSGSQDVAMLRTANEDFREKLQRLPGIIVQRIREGDEAISSLRLETERRNRGVKIVDNIMTANTLFEQRRHARLFLQDQPSVFSKLHTPCEDKTDFVSKITDLAGLFEVDRGPLQRLVSNPRDLGSISLVKLWLEEQHMSYDPAMIETWEFIRKLRNAPPVHHQTEGLVEAVEFFGETFPINYPRLWDKILDRFLQSLLALQELLSRLS